MSHLLERPSRPLNWHSLLHYTAIANIIILVGMGIVLRDRLPLGLAVISAVGLELMHFRGGRLGVIVLGLLFADTAFWTVSATLANVAQGEDLMRLFIPASLSSISLAGIVAAVAILFMRRDPSASDGAVRAVALGTLGLFVLVMLAGLFVGASQTRAAAPQQQQQTRLNLRTENMAFVPTELTATPGSVALALDNRDVWWHTFTIDELRVDLRVPSSGTRQLSFNAPAGTYAYYCAIPGHAALGMKGTLTVR